MTKRKIEAHKGSGNVFADLGLPNPEERLLKANIVNELHRLIKERDDFDDYSAERLMKMLTAFEQDIEITMKPNRKAGKAGRITFKSDAA